MLLKVKNAFLSLQVKYNNYCLKEKSGNIITVNFTHILTRYQYFKWVAAQWCYPSDYMEQNSFKRS